MQVGIHERVSLLFVMMIGVIGLIWLMGLIPPIPLHLSLISITGPMGAHEYKSTPIKGKPSNAEQDYFYLPALGQYGTIANYSGSTTDIPVGNGVNTGSDQRFQTMGNLNDLGKVGYYWLNHAEPWSALYENPAYTLIIKEDEINMIIHFERTAAYGRNYWTAE